jgi:y4mF family transcriptional regulator
MFPIGNMRTIENTEQLGSLIRAERRRLKVTQKELAMAAGTGLRFIIELERGKETTRIGNIFKVLQALGIKILVDSPGNYPDRTRAP